MGWALEVALRQGMRMRMEVGMGMAVAVCVLVAVPVGGAVHGGVRMRQGLRVWVGMGCRAAVL